MKRSCDYLNIVLRLNPYACATTQWRVWSVDDSRQLLAAIRFDNCLVGVTILLVRLDGEHRLSRPLFSVLADDVLIYVDDSFHLSRLFRSVRGS